MTFFPGGTQQFYHKERDGAGGLLPQQVGRWRVSNPAVAEISTTGLAHWLAPGDTEVIYTIKDFARAGMYLAHIAPTIPATLVASPAGFLSMPVGTVEIVDITAFDAFSAPITDFAMDSVVSDDTGIVRVIPLGAHTFAVVAEGVGVAGVTVTVGPVDVVVPFTTVSGSLTQADADARYRRLGITIPDSEVTKVPRVPLGDVSGNVPLPWTLATRAKSMRLVGDVTATLSALPVGEFAHVDVAQGAGGGWHLIWAFAVGLPPVRWDEGSEPPLTATDGRQDSFMFYNATTEIVASKTWENVPTT